MNIKFNRLWKHLEDKHISLKEFQKICNLSNKELELVKSDSEQIDLVMMNKICKGLNCNIADLITHESAAN